IEALGALGQELRDDLVHLVRHRSVSPLARRGCPDANRARRSRTAGGAVVLRLSTEPRLVFSPATGEPRRRSLPTGVRAPYPLAAADSRGAPRTIPDTGTCRGSEPTARPRARLRCLRRRVVHEGGAMPRTEKIERVDELKRRIDGSNALLLAE